MPGKRKYYSENFLAQAMQLIGREGDGGIAQRGRRLIIFLIYDYLVFSKIAQHLTKLRAKKH